MLWGWDWRADTNPRTTDVVFRDFVPGSTRGRDQPDQPNAVEHRENASKDEGAFMPHPVPKGSRMRSTVVLYQATPLTRSCSGTKSDSNALSKLHGDAAQGY